MAKFIVRSSNKKNSNSGGGIEKLKFVKRLLLGRNKSSFKIEKHEELGGYCDSTYVPEDVKEGHFAVIAHDHGGKKEEKEEGKRFVVPLSCLTNPIFVRLLEEAAEEYGFGHEGAVLTIPCRPCDLQRMIEQQWQESY